jgi:hypothetical protein
MAGQRAEDGEIPAESPSEAIDRLAGELEGVGRREAGKAVEYDRAGTLFATWEVGRFAFRLREDIVAAALRTPDTAPSARGSDWVALVPAAPDSFTLDRATAWFETAWRLVGESEEDGISTD